MATRSHKLKTSHALDYGQILAIPIATLTIAQYNAVIGAMAGTIGFIYITAKTYFLIKRKNDDTDF